MHPRIQAFMCSCVHACRWLAKGCLRISLTLAPRSSNVGRSIRGGAAAAAALPAGHSSRAYRLTCRHSTVVAVQRLRHSCQGTTVMVLAVQQQGYCQDTAAERID
jgi:hypothetical protein